VWICLLGLSTGFTPQNPVGFSGFTQVSEPCNQQRQITEANVLTIADLPSTCLHTNLTDPFSATPDMQLYATKG